MASYTPNLNLIKPADADSYDVANDNGNMDKIDAAYASLNGNFGVVHPTTELSSVSDIISLLNQSLNGRYVTFIATATLYETLTGISKRALVTAFKSYSDSNFIEYISVDHDGDARSGYYNTTNSNDKSVYLSSIHNDSVTGTTSSNGNISKTMGNKVRILSAWTSTGGFAVLPYPQAGADGDGQYTWWFHILNDNASSSVVANQNVTVYFTYIRT